MNYFFRALLAIAICAGVAQPTVADNSLQTVIDGAQRSEANKKRDVYRHPKETLEFFGIQPNMTVVELSPGAGWYTEILAPYLREQGQLIVAIPDPQSESEYARNSVAKLQKKLKDDPAIYDKVKITTFEPPAKLNFAPNNSVDMVLTFRNIHNWLHGGDDSMKLLFKNVYLSLKKGGIFGVVEHRVPTSNKHHLMDKSGYVSSAHVMQLANQAGFKLVAESEINANPKDTADHPNGVWALPPTLRNKDVGRQKYIDIGESDRMTLKFVKE